MGIDAQLAAVGGVVVWLVAGVKLVEIFYRSTPVVTQVHIITRGEYSGAKSMIGRM